MHSLNLDFTADTVGLSQPQPVSLDTSSASLLLDLKSRPAQQLRVDGDDDGAQ